MIGFWFGFAAGIVVLPTCAVAYFGWYATLRALKTSGWFWMRGRLVRPLVMDFNHLTVTRRFGVEIGTYRTMSGFGERWIQTATFALGHRTARLSLTREELDDLKKVAT